MSQFGDNTLEQHILDSLDFYTCTQEQKLKALLSVTKYIICGWDDDPTEVK